MFDTMNWRISSPQASFSYQYAGFSSPRESTYLIRRGKRGGRWVGLGFPLPSFSSIFARLEGEKLFFRFFRSFLPLSDPLPSIRRKRDDFFLKTLVISLFFSSANHKSGLPPVSPTFFACSTYIREKTRTESNLPPYFQTVCSCFCLLFFWTLYSENNTCFALLINSKMILLQKNRFDMKTKYKLKSLANLTSHK